MSNHTTVHKFDYLKEYLKGEARLVVENLELTEANYQVAIDELKRKLWEKKEVLINAHLLMHLNSQSSHTLVHWRLLAKQNQLTEAS